MPFELRDNNGTLFRNGYKKDGDKQPDYKGPCKVNGVVLEMAAWIKDGTKGKFMSISFSPPRERPTDTRGAGAKNPPREQRQPQNAPRGADPARQGPIEGQRQPPDDDMEEPPF